MDRRRVQLTENYNVENNFNGIEPGKMLMNKI